MQRVENLSQMLQTSEPYQFLVVGCGISGLQAGAILAEESRRFFMLEAQDYLGGRIDTVPLSSLAHPSRRSWVSSVAAAVQKGATWVDQRHKATLNLCRTLGLSLFEQPSAGSSVYLLDDTSYTSTHLLTHPLFGPEIIRIIHLLEQLAIHYKSQVFSRLGKLSEEGLQLLSLCDSLLIADFFNREISEELKVVRDIFLNFIQNMECVSCKKNSMRQLLTKHSIANDFMNFKDFFSMDNSSQASFRFEAGTSRLVGALVKKIESHLGNSIDSVVRMSHQVLTIDNRYSDYAIVTVEDIKRKRIYQVKTRNVICSVPLAVCKHINFTNLSPTKSRIFHNQLTTSCSKAFIVCKQPFWLSSHNGEGLFSQQYFVNMSHDVSPSNHSCGILVFQIAGEKQNTWQTAFLSASLQQEKHRKKIYLVELMCKLFSVPQSKKNEYFDECQFYEMTFLHDQFIRSGFQSNTRPNILNSLPNLNQSLKTFYEDQHLISFVGSQFSLEYPSYIEGAIRCARSKVYKLLNKRDPFGSFQTQA